MLIYSSTTWLKFFIVQLVLSFDEYNQVRALELLMKAVVAPLALPRLHVTGDQVTTGSGIFSAFLYILATVHVSDSLYSQALSLLTGP